MTALLEKYSADLWWIALLLGLLALLALAYLLYVIRKMSVVRQEADGKPPPVEAPSLASNKSLQQSFTEAIRRLRQAVAGRNFRYQVPWILILGDSESGKSAVLEAARAALPMSRDIDGPKSAGSGCQWWFFEQGVVLDVTGTVDDRGWNRILGLLQRHRPRLPLDSILLAVPASELLASDNLEKEQIAERAMIWNRRLWQAQKTLGLKVPVTLLVTKCDQIPGFSSFWQALPPRHRQEMFGWSNPFSPDALYDGQWIDQAFAGIRADIDLAQLEIAAAPGQIGDVDAMIGFPSQFSALAGPLRAYLDQFLQPSRFYESPPLRGIYFCGRVEPDRQALPGLIRDLFVRKIFAERGLATPIGRSLLSRNRAVRGLQLAMASLVLILSLGFTFATVRLSREASDLAPILRKVATGLKDVDQKEQRAGALVKVTGEDLTFYRQEVAISLLDLMSQVGAQDSHTIFFANSLNLEPVFMPTSLLSGTDERLGDFLNRSFDGVILRAMRDQLTIRTRKTLDNGEKKTTAEEESAGLVAQNASEFKQLHSFVTELGETEKLSKDFNNLAINHDPAGLQSLVRALFKVEMPASFLAHSDLFTDVLGHVKNETFDVTAYRQLATPRARSLTWHLYNHLFLASPLVAQLTEVSERLRDLAQPSANLDDEAMQLGRARDSLDRLSTSLARPEARWIADRNLDLGEPFRQLLAQMSVSNFFDPGLADELATLGRTEFQHFQSRLAAYDAPLIGPILRQDPQGQIESDLSVPAGRLSIALKEMFAQDFMQLPGPASIDTRFDRRRLVWDIDRLTEATRFYEHYDHFIAEQLDGLPPALRDSAARLALSRLQANMNAAVARAETFQENVSNEELASEEALDADIHNFRAAAPLLERILTIFRQFDMGAPLNALRMVSGNQAQLLLMKTDLLLESDNLFAPVRPLAEWDGSVAAGLFAFQVNDAAEMQRYLDIETARLQHLFLDYGMPLVGFLAGRANSRFPDDLRNLARWQSIYEELGKYNNHRPDNALSALQRFLRVDLIAATAANCFDIGKDSARVGSSNYFDQRRNQLAVELSRRCAIIAGDKNAGRYRALAARFNDQLAGRFPFAVDDSGGEADIDLVRAFFRDFGADLPILRDRAAEQAGNDPERGKMANFLRQLAQTATLFKALDGEEGGNGPLLARIAVDFRVNRDSERGANQVIDWSIQSGGRHISIGDSERSLLWQPGEPISVSFRWAKDSPWRPAAGLTGSALVSQDDKAVFSYGGSWSLLRLIDAQISTLGQSRAGGPAPVLLRFEIPLAPAGDPAILFLRLTVNPAGGAASGPPKPALAIPVFPTLAPEPRFGRDKDDLAGGAK